MNIHRHSAGYRPYIRKSWLPSTHWHIGNLHTSMLIATLFVALLLLLQPSSLFAQPTGQVRLLLQKSNPPANIESGRPFEFTLDYACIGQALGSKCEDVILEDLLPADMEYIPGSATTNRHIVSFNANGNLLTWTFVPDLDTGTTGRVRFWARFKPGTIPGEGASNTATIKASNVAKPVTDKSTSATARGEFSMYAEKVAGETVAGFPTTYQLNVCSENEYGGVALLSPIITDTLPADAIFIDAEGEEGVDWVYTPATLSPPRGGTLAFTSIISIPVGGCVSRSVEVEYTDTIPLMDGVENRMDVTGTPDGCTDPGNLRPYCDNQVTHVLTDVLPIEVIAPYPLIGGNKSSTAHPSFAGTEARPGDPVTYTVSASNDGYLPLENVVVTDTIPVDVDVNGFTAGGDITRTVWISYSVNGGAWQEVSGSPFNHNDFISAPSFNDTDEVTLRWAIVEDFEVFADPFVAHVYTTSIAL